jgi:hypothetical protein
VRTGDVERNSIDEGGKGAVLRKDDDVGRYEDNVMVQRDGGRKVCYEKKVV